jgi:hypothetical protein
MTAKHGNSYRAVRARGRQFSLDGLEPRVLLSGGLWDATCSFDADTGVLTIVGTEHTDIITFYPDGLASVKIADVKGIEIFGLGGDDFIEVAPIGPHANQGLAELDIPVTVHGGAGDDEIHCVTTGDDVFYGDEGRDRISMVAGNDLFSCEQVYDFRSEYSRHQEVYDGSFFWAEGGEHLYGNPWVAPVGGGIYYDLDGEVYPWAKSEPESQPERMDGGGEIKPYLPPADGDSPAAEAAQVMPLGTPVSTFSVRPIADDAGELWD